MARRNFVRHQSTLPLRARTADAILRLMGGRKQASVSHDADSPAAVPVPEGAFAEEERYMINGVLTTAQRSLRSIMTPRGEISWVDAEQSEDEIRRQLLSSPHSLFPVCRGELDEIIGIVRAKEMLVATESGKTSRRWLLPPRQLSFRKRWTRSICSGSCVGRAAASSS